jgi:hypothetical protein
MKRKGITLSKNHGVNSSVICCEVCGKDYAIALLGKLKNDEKAPMKIHNGLCDECKKVIDDGGVFIIEVKDGESGNNPYRTGRLIGLNEHGKKALGIDSPICYMEESVFNKVFNNQIINEADKSKK